MKLFPIAILIITLIILLITHVWLPKIIIDTKISEGQALAKMPLPPNFEYVTITTQDKLDLQGIFAHSQKDTLRGTIILLHGIRGYKEHFTPLSQDLNNRGYHTLSLDLRAHGESEGQYCTFGYYEKHDVQSAVDFLLNEKQLTHIGIWGQSLGGAIALQALAIEPRLEFGIVESTFSDFSTIVRDYSENTIGIRIPWLNDYLIYRAGQIAEFEPDSVRPSESSKLITQPMFIAHGDQDKRIKMSYGRKNFNRLSSIKKRFKIVKGANHLNLWQAGGDQYFEQLHIFLRSVTNPQKA